MKIKRVSAKKFLEMVAQGSPMRIIDFRGDYSRAIPGTIPTQFDYDIFYEDAAWIQDMLGVEFQARQPLALVCEHGLFSERAAKLFIEKNPELNLELLILKGGWEAYQAEIARLTRRLRNGVRFVAELSSLATPAERCRHVLRGLLDRRTFWQRWF
ncbi:MAG: hypothetical protein HW380_2712 [Magnetococcales bacterium]|nr:hypothetical protein [Magnetococcales bacterium]